MTDRIAPGASATRAGLARRRAPLNGGSDARRSSRGPPVVSTARVGDRLRTVAGAAIDRPSGPRDGRRFFFWTPTRRAATRGELVDFYRNRPAGPLRAGSWSIFIEADPPGRYARGVGRFLSKPTRRAATR